MKIWVKRIAVTVAALIFVAVTGAIGLFYFAKQRVASNMHAPHLVRQPQPAVDFTYRTLDGREQQLSNLKGKVVFLDLWGTWCLQCVVEMPTVQKLYDHYKNDPQVVFLIVSRMDTPDAVKRYAHRNSMDLPFYITHDEDIPPSMHLQQFPSTFLYDKEGRMEYVHLGAADWSQPSVIAFIDDLKKN